MNDTENFHLLHQQLDQVERLLTDSPVQGHDRLMRVSQALYGDLPANWLSRALTAPKEIGAGSELHDENLMWKIPTNRKQWLTWLHAPYQRPGNAQVARDLERGLAAQEMRDLRRFAAGTALVVTVLVLGVISGLMAHGFLVSPLIITAAGGLASIFGGVTNANTHFFGEARIKAKKKSLEAHNLTHQEAIFWRAHPAVAKRAMAFHQSDVPMLNGDADQLNQFAEILSKGADEVGESPWHMLGSA